jgi:hypothetical protein
MSAEASVEAMFAAADVAYEFHISAPEHNEAVFAGLAGRRARLLARWNEARAAGDWDLANRVMLDVLDVNYVTAAAAEALQAQRRAIRCPWPPRGMSVLYIGDWP